MRSTAGASSLSIQRVNGGARCSAARLLSSRRSLRFDAVLLLLANPSDRDSGDR
jgi:hypothetical protein